LLIGTQAGAQSLAGISDSLPDGDIAIIGGGWSQWRNTEEILAFFLDTLATLVLASAIVFHPVRRRAAVTLASLGMPRLFFLYALIGMVVGFLVEQHGYIIGFVVFGIGALLRFRSNLDDPVDTVEMILVTVLGLCVGLNLPIMALAIAAVSWVVIAISGRSAGFEVSVKAAQPDALDGALAAAVAAAEKRGWTVAGLHRTRAKGAGELIVRTGVQVDEGEVSDVMSAAFPGEEVTWKIRS
jgi:hypothetical protein